MNNIELGNLLNQLIELGKAGKNPIPIELLDKHIETITQLIQQSKHINYVMSEFFKYDKIENDISAPVMNDQVDLITLLDMRLSCYKTLKELYV